jgi:hypothetical protein
MADFTQQAPKGPHGTEMFASSTGRKRLQRRLEGELAVCRVQALQSEILEIFLRDV